MNSLTEPRPTLLVYKYDMPGEIDVTQTELWDYSLMGRHLDRVPAERVEGSDAQRRPLPGQGVRQAALHPARPAPAERRVLRDRPEREQDDAPHRGDRGRRVVGAAPREVREARRRPALVVGAERLGPLLPLHERRQAGEPRRYRDPSAPQPSRRSTRSTSGSRRSDGRRARIPTTTTLYRIDLDGKNLALLDPGDADHASSLSEDHRYVVDVRSRTDLETAATLRDDDGKPLLDLEKADVARLKAIGWAMPELFTVKAAGRRHRSVGQHVAARRLRSQEEVSDHHLRLSRTADGVGDHHLRRDRDERTARAARIHRRVVRGARRLARPLERLPELRLRQPARLRPRGQEDRHRGARGQVPVDRPRPGRHLRPLGRRIHARRRPSCSRPTTRSSRSVGRSRATTTTTSTTRTGRSSTTASERSRRRRARTRRTPRTTASRRPSPTRPQFIGGNDGPTRFQIKVPTNAELAANLKGNLMLVHGDMDDNVHYAGTYRLMNALMRANKRYDFLLVLGQAPRVRRPDALRDPTDVRVLRGAPARRSLRRVGTADLLDHG